MFKNFYTFHKITEMTSVADPSLQTERDGQKNRRDCHIQRCWQVISPTRNETRYSDRRFWLSYILFIIITGGILVLFISITRLSSNEIFSPSNKIHREVGWA